MANSGETERSDADAPDGGEEQGVGLADALRRYVEAVAGAAQAPRERAGRLVAGLAERGESRAKDIQKAARELAERSARDRRELVGLIQKEIRRQIEALGLVRRSEVEGLQQRVSKLEDSAPETADRKPER